MIIVNNNLHLNDEDLNFYLGKYYFEIGDYLKAKDALMSAYMLEGKEIFEDEDNKYFSLIQDYI